MHKQIIYFDMDGVLVDIKGIVMKKYGFDGLDRIGDLLDEDPSLFAEAEPINGAIEAFNKLAERYEVYILSTAPWHNPESWMIKRNWVEHHLGQNAYKRLILSHNKGLLKGDFLIDDRTVNGVEEFEGTHIHFGNQHFPNWNSVIDFFKMLEE